MKRPDKHLIDSAGKRLLRAALEPLGWTLNETSDDYGIDSDVEVFAGGESTGITFKLQLKSSRASKYSAAGDFVSQTIGGNQARYLASELKVPSVLVHADVRAQRLFWTAPQIDSDFVTTLQSALTGNVTVRIPTTNELPAGHPRLLAVLARTALHLATQAIASAPSTDFLAAFSAGPNAAKRAAEFLRKAESLKLQQAQNLVRAEQLTEALPLINGVRNDQAASVEGRFAAELMHYGVNLRLLDVTSPQSVRAALAAQSIRWTKTLVRTGYPHLKLYALIRQTALEFDQLVEQGWGLSMNQRIQQSVNDPIWEYALQFQQAANLQRTARKYRQLIRLTTLAIRSPHAWAVPNAVVEIPRVLVRLAARLEADEQHEAALAFRHSGLNWCKLVATLGQAASDLNAMISAILTGAMFARPHFVDPREWARTMSSGIQNEQTRSQVNELLAEIEKRQAVVKERPDSIEEEFEIQRQILTSMAESVGINLTDPNDRIAWILRVGLADLDPSRILKTCEHIFITLGPQGLPAQWLGLPTAASKTLHCTLHGFGVGSFTLDQALAFMKAEHCDSCSDRCPRPDSWKYSYEWQQEQNTRFGGKFKDPMSSGLFPGRDPKRPEPVG
jgi:hypothetical protein